MEAAHRPSLAVYAGTFDPVTYGHLDILQRACDVFDKVLVAVVETPSKKQLFTAEERLAFLEEATVDLAQVEVRLFSGLLVRFAKTAGAKVIIRGLRAISDFEYEFQMALMNRQLAPDMDTVFMMTSPEHAFLSSSLVKEVAALGGPIAAFVPANVEAAVRSRCQPSQASPGE